MFRCFCISTKRTTDYIDPEQLETIRKERQAIFDELIEDPTNQGNLFKYANLSIISGDLEAAIGVFEQMLIYDPTLARIRLELGALFQARSLRSSKTIS